MVNVLKTISNISNVLLAKIVKLKAPFNCVFVSAYVRVNNCFAFSSIHRVSFALMIENKFDIVIHSLM